MAQVPLEAADTISFVPPSLQNIEFPPTFRLRAGTRRDREDYQFEVTKYGLRIHSDKSMRVAAFNGLKELWSPEEFAREEGRIRQYLDAVEHFKQNAKPGDKFDYDETERGRVEALWESLATAWPPLRHMAADNLRFELRSPSILLSILVTGWFGIDVPFGREAGLVTLDKIAEVETALRLAETDALEKKIEGVGEPGTSFEELQQRASLRMFLTREQEKNLLSPPPSSPSPLPMKATGPAKGRGRSKVSATLPKTLATS